MSPTRALTVIEGGANAPQVRNDGVALRRGLSGPVRIGLVVIGVFLVGFGAWAAIVPLAGGAVAPAIISPDGSRKTVQHLEGGIIAKVRVRDGDVVHAGQPLVVLDNIQPKANYETLLTQYETLLTMRARLLAEKAGQDAMEIPAELRDKANDPGLRALFDGQRQLLRTRYQMHISRQRVLKQRIEQFEEQIGALNAQVESTTQQIALIQEELEGKEQLQRKGILPKPELLRLQRMHAELLGRRGEYVGSIAKTKQQIGETELQVLALDAERMDKIAEQLDQVRVDLSTTNERLFASKDVLNRTVLTAPVSGTVVNLRFKTEGGVVQKGEPILDIVPLDDVLLIDARVSPNDIDIVHNGLPAQVHLLAYSSRTAPRISGTVRSVSADRLLDDNTRQPYYLARVEVDREELKRIAPEVDLVPGMPAEVLIVAGERTLVQYLFKPFIDALRRSFRES
ncbi:HlyD family secretion protein/epimerase transport system membrane fusion protein [Microvirga subterranea]|uniref:Membrane fusion protein (MFP) family protein n=2 Tax=Microvirga subterranea TaxID=186651 RepID=A0A370HS66_9HYPH|nr:HlyD family secretion protein/epimerase transport system membrane fusion protein [Microvirga subterranea]